MVPLPGEIQEPYPERDKAPNRRSEWLPADWVESLIEGPSAQAEVIEIQPGVRWTPQGGPHVSLPQPAPDAASPQATPGASLLEIAARVIAPIRAFRLPGLRLPRISPPNWPHRRQLAVMTAAALALATPVVIGQLSSGLTGTSRSYGGARSPYSPAPVSPAPGLHGSGAAAKATAAPVGSASAAAAQIRRTGSAAAGTPGARPASGNTSSSPSQPPAPSGGSGSHSSPSTPSAPSPSASSRPTTSGSTQGSAGGGGGGGAPPSSNPGSPGGDGNPGPQSPLAPVQSAVSGAPSTVQGVVSQVPKLH